jgi:hypothetical protein
MIFFDWVQGKGYDIAILKLSVPLSSAEMSKLDKIRLGDDDDLSWIQTLALGWGKTTDGILSFAKI